MSPSLPLIGRQAELDVLVSALDATQAGRGGTVFLVGESGVGKTRLATTIADQARERGWRVGWGSAYPTETGVPFAPFAGALLPLLRSLDPAEATVLTRGDGGDLASLFLGPPMQAGQDGGDPAERKMRLLWNVTQFATRLADRRPLLLVLDNLQWADPSSLELLHFLGRQVVDQPILLLGAINDAAGQNDSGLAEVQRSLASSAGARTLRLGPLSLTEVAALVRNRLDADVPGLAELLHARTLGNPFFVEEVLKSLAESGQLRDSSDGWNVEALELPHSIRETLLARVQRLSPAANDVARLAAVVGTRVSYGLLRAATDIPESDLVNALDELCAMRVLAEGDEPEQYDFTHPLLREAVCAELGSARTRLLHTRVAEAMEAVHGERAHEHAGELAFHFARANAEASQRAHRYYVLAGRQALARYANQEAADYLMAATESGPETPAVLADLARARFRLGEHDQALALWERAAAMLDGQPEQIAAIRRHMGLACFWSARYSDALAQYDRGLAAARQAGSERHEAALLLARGVCLQEIGRVGEARTEVEAALRIAERLDDDALLARVHRALLVVFAWTGPFDRAREHGARAVALAEVAGDRVVACSAHWTWAMVEGLTGGADAAARHMAESERLARELGSPVLRLWTAEMQIVHASATGDWEHAIRLADRMIALARSLGQQTVLPRLLVWSALIHLARGEMERGKALVDEAWELAGDDVHARVLAHTGLAAYHSATQNHAEARRIGEQGLALADRTGYVIWAIHHLIPIVAESYLWLADTDGAEALGHRLRAAADHFGHRLARAWAEACEGLVLYFRGDLQHAAVPLRAAIAELEQIPIVLDAVRLRRQLGHVLAKSGDRDGGVSEFRTAHNILARLGAEPELALVREHLRALGARPPVRPGGPDALSAREREIVRLAAEGRSNKAIGRELGISPRTAGTHLVNIYQKVGVGSREELADLARRHGLVS